MAAFIERNNQCLKLLTFPTVVYNPAGRGGRNSAHNHNRHNQVRSPKPAGSRMREDRKEPGCHSSQGHNLVGRAPAPAQFLRDPLGDGGRADGAHDYGAHDYGVRGLCLPTHGLWALTRAGRARHRSILFFSFMSPIHRSRYVPCRE